MTYNTTPTFHEVFGEVPKGLLSTLKRGKVTPAEFYLLESMGYAGRDMNEFVKQHTTGGSYREPFPVPHRSEWKKA